MEPFRQLSGIAAVMPHDNINTDAIIPVIWMRSPTADLAKGLFARHRYTDDEEEIPEFILNRDPFRNSRIIVGGENFGCGSSREAAVWALLQFGIRCIIAPSFGDIFQENAFKNGLLPVTLATEDIDRISGALGRAETPTLTIDLEECHIVLPDGDTVVFDIPAPRRRALLGGLDEVLTTLAHEGSIAAFQSRDSVVRPWIYFQSADPE